MVFVYNEVTIIILTGKKPILLHLLLKLVPQICRTIDIKTVKYHL